MIYTRHSDSYVADRSRLCKRVVRVSYSLRSILHAVNFLMLPDVAGLRDLVDPMTGDGTDG